RELQQRIAAEEKLRIAAEVGSDLPFFLIGGTVLGVGRGEEVFPLPDLPPMDCVLATPEAGVSTPKAFVAWDEFQIDDANGKKGNGSSKSTSRKLTASTRSDRINEFSRSVSGWLNGFVSQQAMPAGGHISGVPRGPGRRDRAEALLLDLVRT